MKINKVHENKLRKFHDLSIISLFSVKDTGEVIPVFLTEHHAMKAYWGVEV
jgi:hypothetical protein